MMNTTIQINADEMLEYLEKDGTIDLAQIQAVIMEKKIRDQVGDHHYWQGKDGFWRTYVSDETKAKGRRLIKRKYEKDILECIIKSKEISQVVTVSDMFYEWLNRQLKNNSISKSTYTRYNYTFNRHFITCKWDKKPIDSISVNDWVYWIEDEIERLHLTHKSLAAFKLIIKPIIKLAKRKGLITYSASDVLEDVMKKPYKVHKSDESQILNPDDFAKLRDYLCDNPSTQDLGLLFMILSGIRVGELVTLKYDDFISDTCAEIKRTETCFKDFEGVYHYEVKESPKTEAGFRKVFIPTEYSWIIKEMKALSPFAEYICTDEDGNRMTAQNLRSKMYRVCEKIDIDKKSPHKARKTFASALLDAGAGNATVISLMGHTDISTTEAHYHKDRRADSEKQRIVDNIIEFRRVSNS